MLKKLRIKIENKRGSKGLLWKSLVFLKDAAYHLLNKTTLLFKWLLNCSLLALGYYLKILFNYKLRRERKNVTKAICDLTAEKPAPKIDLKDITFIIPVRYDSKERKKNLEIVIKYLKQFFDTNIIVGEEDSQKHFEYLSKDVEYIFESSDNPLFHRTKLLNIMTKAARTKLIANYDSDVLFKPIQVYDAVQILRLGHADFVYPYFLKFLNLTGDNLMGPDFSVGGAIFYRKDIFTQGGMENEKFISWGYEDNERFARFRKLGCRIARTLGACYHLDHPQGINSSRSHGRYLDNIAEFKKVQKMTKKELKKYIETWSKDV